MKKPKRVSKSAGEPSAAPALHQASWRMPNWMHPYADLITNTGDSDPDRVKVIERMYNGNADPFVNLPLSTLQACVKSQVALLYRMFALGLLNKRRSK